MATNEEFEELKGRIVELESKLADAQRGGGAKRTVADLSPDDVQAYLRVKDVLDWGDGGISRCVVVQCYQPCIVRCINVCINECTCGPCSLGGQIPGGLNRFGGLGG